jgi:hypothetical protein
VVEGGVDEVPGSSGMEAHPAGEDAGVESFDEVT